MSKLIACLLALLVTMLVVVGVMPWGMPESEELIKELEVPGKKEFCIENRDITSRIYTVKDKKVEEIYEELRFEDGLERNILKVAYDNGNTYFLRMYNEDLRWEIIKLSENGSKKIMDGSFSENMRITSLTANEETFWITTVDENEKVTVFECKEDFKPIVKLLLPNVWPQKSSKATFDGEKLFLTVEEGDQYIVELNGKLTHTGKFDEGSEKVRINIPDELWFSCKKRLIFVTLLTWLAIATSSLLTSVVSKKAKKLATKIMAICSEILLLIAGTVAIISFFATVYSNGIGTAVKYFPDIIMFSLIIWGVGVLILAIVLKKVTKPLKTMVEQMEEISEGRVNVRKVEKGNNELHKMNGAIQELSMNVSIQNYEIASTVKSYHRFIPERLTELLDRANVGEVTCGDNRRITGNIGLFSVGNRREARMSLGDDAFVDFINLSLDMYQNSISDNHGCMISSGLRLSTMETLFTESAADGVRAGLDFIGQTQKINKSGIPAPAPVLVLHRTSFLYGIAGEKDRLYPYLSSAELEFLGGFTEKFYAVGVRIVATESYIREVKDSGFTVRHIGFVSDGEREAYKLYEILDTYSVLERNIRIGYDEKFQEALNLFYKNDFFLARNIFSTLLRACPSDGIVRWYMFACENLFNADKNVEIDYSIFGTSEA